MVILETFCCWVSNKARSFKSLYKNESLYMNNSINNVNWHKNITSGQKNGSKVEINKSLLEMHFGSFFNKKNIVGLQAKGINSKNLMCPTITFPSSYYRLLSIILYNLL